MTRPTLRGLPPALLISVTIAAAAISLLIATAVVDTDPATSSVSPQDLVNAEANGKVTVEGSVEEGEPVPAASFPYLDGSAGTMADFADRPLLVNFWASTCGPCREEMPALQAAYEEYGEEIGFLGVDVGESVEAGREFARETGATYPLARDPRSKLLTAFGGIALPHTVLIDADGDVRAIRNQSLDAADLDELIGSVR